MKYLKLQYLFPYYSQFISKSCQPIFDHSFPYLAKSLNHLGYEFLYQGDIKAAKALMKKNLELFPDHWNVNDSYAEVLMIEGDYDESLKYYKRSLELNPYNYNAIQMIDSISRITAY